MAQVKFQTEIVKFCPNCALEFQHPEPTSEAENNIIICGDLEDDTSLGCKTKFIVKIVED